MPENTPGLGSGAGPGSSLHAPALLLARTADPALGLDVTRYLVSEKLDGVRAYWTGERLLHRSGQRVQAPREVLARLPAHALDGELWLGRGRFDELSALLRRHDGASSALWQEVRYVLFELPGAPGSFAQRWQALQAVAAGARSKARELAGPGAALLQVLPQHRLADRAALMARLDEVLRGGGEGLMLHQAEAAYVTGRSEVLLKIKPLADAEAVVIGHLPGRGRHAGRVGALRVRTEDGREFALGAGLSDALRERAPPPGAVVVYRYRGLTSKGLPRFATYWRVRDSF